MGDGSAKMTKGISRRQYARQRGCDERLVRRKIADGSLVAAVQPDGKLDGAIADRLWTTTTGPRVQGTLAAARRRRLRASCNVLAWNVGKLRDSLIEVGHIAEGAAAMVNLVDATFGPLPSKLAPSLAGQPAPRAFVVLDDNIRAALTDLAESNSVTYGEGVVHPTFELAGLDETGLATARHNFAAERTELLHRRQRGDLLVVDEVIAGLTDAITRFRTRLCYLPGKLAPHFLSRNVAESARLLRRELDDALRDLKRWLHRAAPKESVDADTYA